MILKYFSSCCAAPKIILRDTGLILRQCCHQILFANRKAVKENIWLFVILKITSISLLVVHCAAPKILLRDTGLILWQCFCHLILFGGEGSQRKTIECILLQTFDCSPSSDLQLSYCPQFLLFIININLNIHRMNHCGFSQAIMIIFLNC